MGAALAWRMQWVTCALGALSLAGCDAGHALVDGAPATGPPMPAPPADVPDAATATLLALSLEGFTLRPAFSPDVHDYTIACTAGANATVVRASAPSGVSLAMVRPVRVPLAAPAPIAPMEDDAIVVEATSGAAVADYWVRCLPHDFPPMTMARHAATTPGWYVTGNASAASGEAGYAMVLDMNGTPVWYRAMAPGQIAGDVTEVATDVVAFMSTTPERFDVDPAGHFDVLHLSTGARSTLATVGSATDEHELLPLANGDTLMLTYPPTAGIDMSARGVTGTTTIADCGVQEIAPDGSLVWSWLGSQHFDVVRESTELATGTIGGASVIDPFHCNSIDVDAAGDLLLSARQLDAVVLVSRATGRVIWKLGGVAWNEDGAQTLEVEGDAETGFYHQHDARFRPNGDVTVFDDHTTNDDSLGPPSGVARGLELALDLAAGAARVVWEYDGTTYSAATGSFRRNADGSNVIGWGVHGGPLAGLAMSEVDDAGADLADLTFDAGDHAYRVVKVPLAAFDVEVLRRTAGAR